MFNEFVVSKSQNTEILRVTTFSVTAPNVVAQFMFPAKEWHHFHDLLLTNCILRPTKYPYYRKFKALSI